MCAEVWVQLEEIFFNISVRHVPIVRWQPPPLCVVEGVAIRIVDALVFLGIFGAVPSRSSLFAIFHKYVRTLLCRNPPSNDLLNLLQQTVPPSRMERQRNAVIQQVREITRRAKPKPKPKLKPNGFQSMFHKQPPTPSAPRKCSRPHPKAPPPLRRAPSPPQRCHLTRMLPRLDHVKYQLFPPRLNR